MTESGFCIRQTAPGQAKRIPDSPDFDRGGALEQQIALLTLKKEHDEYAAQAKASWGNTPEVREPQFL